MTQTTRPVPTSASANVREGLATLGPELVALKSALESRFLSWAADCDAPPMLYPPLMRVSDLHRLDYFQNFPHLAILGSALTEQSAERFGAGTESAPEIPADALTPAAYALPSAACYNIYLDMAGRRLETARRVTTVATCFRRETHYDGLRRLLGFTMREIVCVGDRETVLTHLRTFKERIRAWAEALGLPLEVAAASDPFFDSNASRAVMAQLFPVKEEFVYDGTLAIASVNFHRNFFGERCDIRDASGAPVFSGCVAFGVERWMSALTAHFDVTPAELAERVITTR